MTYYKPDVVVLPPSSILQDEIPKLNRSTRLYQFQAPSEYKHIQETDAPERLQIQLLRSGSTPLDADSLTSESNGFLIMPQNRGFRRLIWQMLSKLMTSGDFWCCNMLKSWIYV